MQPVELRQWNCSQWSCASGIVRHRANFPEHSERSERSDADGERKCISQPLRQFLRKALQLNPKQRVSSMDALCEPVFDHWAKRNARFADDLNAAREETCCWRTHMATQISMLERDGFRFQNFELQLPLPLPHRQYQKSVLPFACELSPQSVRPPVDSSYSQNANVAIRQAINSSAGDRKPQQPAPKLNPVSREVAGHLAVAENARTL